MHACNGRAHILGVVELVQLCGRGESIVRVDTREVAHDAINVEGNSQNRDEMAG